MSNISLSELRSSIVEQLVTLNDAEILPYEDISDFDTRKHRRTLIQAVSQAERLCGCLFEAVRGEGIMRMEQSYLPEMWPSGVKDIAQYYFNQETRLRNIKKDKLNDDDRSALTERLSILDRIAEDASVADQLRSEMESRNDVLKPLTGQQLHDWRVAAALTQVAAATKMGISRASFVKWEANGDAYVPKWVGLCIAAVDAGLAPYGDG
ncbi:MAG: hypothetical protein ABJL72_18105 [Roseobacter sp.]